MKKGTSSKIKVYFEKNKPGNAYGESLQQRKRMLDIHIKTVFRSLLSYYIPKYLQLLNQGK